jgi:TonB-linked SusC/RagA family outer membrane protein
MIFYQKAIIMRIVILGLFLTINGILMASDSSGQDLSRIRISIHLNNVPLKTALKKIEDSTNLSFSFRTTDIAAYKKISLIASDITLEKLLSQLFYERGLIYELVNSNIIIRRKDPAEEIVDAKIIDDGGIRGRVTTGKGEPVANASVMIKELKLGTAADNDGRFSFSGIAAGNYTLQISAVGYASQTKMVSVTDNNVTDIGIDLSLDNSNMTEVTVTALGIRREKRELGYSAQEVKGEALSASHQSNIVNALQGQATGLQINSGGGAPGQGAKIILRGISSLDPRRDFQPLFVVDGIPIDNTTDVTDGSELNGMGNRASDINPDDIESVNILKGGAATALYGLRASTGAIIITTKSGKSGRVRASLTTTGSIDEINKYPKTQKKYSQGFLSEYDPTSFWPSYGPSIEEAKALDPTHPDELFNNYKHGYKTGHSIRNSLNVSGGTEKAIFTGSFSQFNQEGIMPFTNYKNYSVKLGGEFRFSEKLRMNASVNYIKSGGRRANADRYNENLTYFSPRWDIWDYIKEDGTQNTIVGSGNENPIYVLYGKKYVDDVDRIIANGNIVYSPVKWLDINYRFGTDLYNDSRTQTTPGPLGLVDEIYPASDFGYGTIYEYHAKNTVLNSTLMLNFKNKIGSHIESSFKIGQDVYSRERSSVSTKGDTLNDPQFYSLSNAKRVLGQSNLTEYRIIGLFADWTLGFDNFLYLNLTGRNDYTSTLSKENRSFFYPSASLSWVFTENFEAPKWWNFGKLRASVARIGKDAPPYATSEGYLIGTREIPDVSDGRLPLTNGVSPFNLDPQTGDKSLKPEFTTSYEAGIEARFLNNRLGIDVTYYNNTSKDLIIPVKVPVTSGFEDVYLNAGSIRNKGIEISLNGTPVETKDLTWNFRINYTKNTNKVLEIYPGLSEISLASQFGYLSSTVTQKFIPGFPVGALFGRTYERYYGDKVEDPMILDKSLPIVIGDNGFPVLNPASKQQYIANSQPKWIGSASTSIRFKQFMVSLLFDTQQGVYRYNQFANFLGAFALNKESENRNDTKVFDGVLENGSRNTKVVWLGQGIGPDGVDYGNGYYRNYYRGASETFIEDASWVRLRTAAIGYTLPAEVVQRTGFLQGATVTLSGNNLWLHTKWSTFDPEASSTNSGSLTDGFSGFTYPATRSYILSVNLNF